MKSARQLLPALAVSFVAVVIALAMTSQSPRAADTLNKEEVGNIIHEYLAAHPEVVIEAIQAYQDNQREIDQRMFEKTLKESKADLVGGDHPFAGNPKGDVTMVEFFDYNCGYCKRALKDVTKLIEADKNIKVIFREMPILSDSSRVAARYALAAHKQGKYFEFHKAVMEFSGARSVENLEKIGKDIGLDVDKLRKDANSKEIDAEIQKSKALSQKLGIRGTPAFIIGDVLSPGYLTYQDMQAIIKQVRDDKNKG